MKATPPGLLLSSLTNNRRPSRFKNTTPIETINEAESGASQTEVESTYERPKSVILPQRGQSLVFVLGFFLDAPICMLVLQSYACF
mmetsp:Transcript_13363/g.20882  ORF Transcript_13363/g.20882 Transcript_13363/m.20882 type:complete len:86 (-) Transcript_13363:2649-2906(-)